MTGAGWRRAASAVPREQPPNLSRGANLPQPEPAGGQGDGAPDAGSARGAGGGARPRPLPSALRLPEQWAAGFPALRLLSLAGLGIPGSLPLQWLDASAFPLLAVL